MAQLASITAPFALQFITIRLAGKKTFPPLRDKTSWGRVTSNELRNSLNTVILPLVRVDVGLPHHCSLLFKVRADRINLLRMLVKGSSYTGTDDGAENLIKMDDGSEYIIDLMGASGTLIPAEVPRSLLLDSALGAGGFSDSSGSNNKLSLVLHQVTRAQEVLPDVDEIPKAHTRSLEEALPVGFHKSSLEEAIPVGCQPKHHSDNNKAKNSEHRFEKLVPSAYIPTEASPLSVEGVLLTQEQKVKSVSKYVIRAEFAQKLHAVLLESGAFPPPDLFSDIAAGVVSEQKLLEPVHPEKKENVELRTSCNSTKYWSNNALSLRPPSGVHPLDVFGCDNTLKHVVEESTRHQLEPVQHLVNYELCSESKKEGLLEFGPKRDSSTIREFCAPPCAARCTTLEGYVRLFTRMGLDVALADSKGNTPLTLTVSDGPGWVCERLIFRQAHCDVTESKLDVALQHVRKHKGPLDMLPLMMGDDSFTMAPRY